MAVRRRLLYLVLALVLVGVGMSSGALASKQIPTQVPLFTTYPTFFTTYAFTDPLPYFGATGAAPRVQAGSALGVSYHEFQQQVLPSTFYATLPTNLTIGGTVGPPNFPAFSFNPQSGAWVWGYQVGGAPMLYPGVTVEAQQGTSTQVTYTNSLAGSTTDTYPILQRYITIDQTIHWANPNGLLPNDPNRFLPYSGPQPVVAHFHGGEVRSDSDGGPDEWFTPGGEGPVYQLPTGNGKRGPGYKNNVYTYNNAQEATTLWFHEHTLGATRTNVFAGLAAFYFLRDQYDTGLPGSPLNLPIGPQEVELVFQDRQFDDTGQLFFPDGTPPGTADTLFLDPTNPLIHPYWIPEFFGNVVVVNGKAWPYFTVEAKRYRFHLLGGANARFWQIELGTAAGGTPNPPIYVIGTDGGFLDAPVKVSSLIADPITGIGADWLLMAPGERYDIIVDFTGLAGQTINLWNYAAAPYPAGTSPVGQPYGQMMQFRVVAATTPDTSYDPATGGPLRGGVNQPPAIVRFTDGAGNIAPGVTISKKRQLVLREVLSPTGPIEVLVNNTQFEGFREGTRDPIPGARKLGANWINEMPQVGSTEEWEIINLTGDAHPMHFHLIQFQLLSRQAYNDVGTAGYTAVYERHFPGGVAIDGYGPPLPYNNLNLDGAYGGNPSISPFLTGNPVKPPNPWEYGWKDTVIAYPGEVTRIIARWAPQGVSLAGVSPGQNLFPFDATYGPGYVWHCHIIDHEDNEMMRPYIPTRNPNNTLFSGVPIINFMTTLDDDASP
jgi:spore coat protein A, manganese oxidase